jgi:MSHA biogenesis protein MshJ
MSIAVSSRLRPWLDRVDNLDLRERILLLLAGVAVMFLLVDSLFLQPTLKDQQVTEQRISGLEVKLNALRQNAQLLNLSPDIDPLTRRELQRAQLQDELSALDERITGQLGALTEPAQAAQLLEQVLNEHAGLKLATLNASSRTLDDTDLGSQSQTSALARYQLELVVQGNYLDLLSYLQSLEHMPWKFIWQQIDFQTTEYPDAETRLQLYTLGAADA